MLTPSGCRYRRSVGRRRLRLRHEVVSCAVAFIDQAQPVVESAADNTPLAPTVVESAAYSAPLLVSSDRQLEARAAEPEKEDEKGFIGTSRFAFTLFEQH
jgi:hypothetical protein